MKIKLIQQYDQMDCGPACLTMIANYFGQKYYIEEIRKITFKNRNGVSFLGLIKAGNNIGLKSTAYKLTLEELIELNPKAAIIYWNQNHFVTLVKIKKYKNKYSFIIADPTHSILECSVQEFTRHYIFDNNKGAIIQFSPQKEFFEKKPQKRKIIITSIIINYLKTIKGSLITIFLLLLLGNTINFFFPFLTQLLIDKGVNNSDISIIGYILLSQLFLHVSSLFVEAFNNYIILKTGTKISIQIIGNFLTQLLAIPISFFETKVIGDFQQRIIDNSKIENFLTSNGIIVFISLISFIVFFLMLAYYSIKIIAIFISMTLLSVTWSLYWIKKRKIMDYSQFQQRSQSQSQLYEIIHGISDIKLNNLENTKKQQWESVQTELYQTNRKLLKIDQIQSSGYNLINNIKNITITYISTLFVIKGNITLGQLLAISYITGQLNSPINQLVSFFRSLQDATLSINRLNEVYNEKKEIELLDSHIKYRSLNNNIVIKNLSFYYPNASKTRVLKNINLTIPKGKTTAIVGSSGSGKTTLMKILLKFYNEYDGEIIIGNNLRVINPLLFRKDIGVVMQNGFIYSDTILNNITSYDNNIDNKLLKHVLEVSNLTDYINNLPQKILTKIGSGGNGISEGQKQRILIARALYKKPTYMFLDEATSALDAENENIIHKKLQDEFNNKTVVIIAHRLSTVKNADQIVVLKNGEIIEIGNHSQLVTLKKEYYKLVKNQLELGK